jgi:hypothetical protein
MNTPNEIFGDPTDFAIEVGLEPDAVHTASFLWGHTRLWCGGISLGNIDNRCCGLNAHSFESMAKRLDDLWHETLEGLDDQAIWNLLDGALYGYHGDIELQDDRPLIEIKRDAVRYSKFDFLTNWGEQFDGYKSFLISPPSNSLRVLSRSFPKQVGLGVNISKSSFIQASNDFYKWHQSQLESYKTETNP